MGLTKLGECILQSDARNTNGIYGSDMVVGLSTQKEIIQTKADLTGVDLSSYKLMRPGYFAYVPDTSRRGDKMSLAYNQTERTFLVSSISIVFSVSKPEKLMADYLFMYFNRPEFDRYARYNSWGSARETFSWDDMCDTEINLPPVHIQKKYADIYNAMLTNQKSYEEGLDDLKLTCDVYIENIRRKMPHIQIGPYIEEQNIRNRDMKVINLQGVNNEGRFVRSRGDTNGLDFSNYKIVRTRQFAYNPSRINLGSIALLDSEDCIVSPMYIVFNIREKNVLLPEYLMMWLNRNEFKRYAFFNAAGSVRDVFDFHAMTEVEIPIPDISVQWDIVNIYNSYMMRKDINERLKAQIKDVCPILIRGSLEGAGE